MKTWAVISGYCYEHLYCSTPQQAPIVNQLVQNIRKDTWSLSLLAVSPHHRRKHIAHNLCKLVMDKVSLNRIYIYHTLLLHWFIFQAIAQGEGASVLTQSQDNVSLFVLYRYRDTFLSLSWWQVKIYENMGFSVFGDARIVGAPGGDYTIFSLTFNWPPMEFRN
jgi:hypothetical protein